MEAEELKKIKQALSVYCSYRERSVQEVKMYIKKFRLEPMDEDKIICELIENDVVNDYRYAQMFVSGKFRINGWGREKIAFNLQQQGISQNIIQIALQVIDEEDYENVALKLLKKKQKEIEKTSSPFELRKKMFAFLKSRGFESELINDLLNAHFHFSDT
ncbi:MAG: regulatory protein RecX [Thermaurantimonas sp.]|uniref:regulatory protein RecX n=1 Tax=Thermaurantimonas sp. TaxID=2681568 RepID=UPI00391886B2